MQIKWLGHAAFLLTARDGTRVITDPYATGAGLSYGQIKESADVVLVSHEHGDHNNVAAIKGSPEVIRGAGTHKAKGIEFRGVASFHDPSGGRQRGPNTIFCFTLDGVRLCHLGDLGHVLSGEQVAQIGQVDVLFLPVGGFYTIDAREATRVMGSLKPKIAIPMHFKTPKCDYPISPVEEFLQGKESVRRVGGSEVEVEASSLPKATSVWVLEPAL